MGRGDVVGVGSPAGFSDNADVCAVRPVQQWMAALATVSTSKIYARQDTHCGLDAVEGDEIDAWRLWRTVSKLGV